MNRPLLALLVSSSLILPACGGGSSGGGGNPPPDLKSPVPAPTPQLLRDIRPGVQDSLRSDFIQYQGVAWFLAEDGTNGIGLWRTDGTPAGTILVRSLIQVGGQAPAASELLLLGDQLYIGIDDDQGNGNAWRSDGTEAGTTALAPQWPGDTGPRHMATLGTSLCIATRREVWNFDPNSGALTRLADPSRVAIPWLHSYGGQLFFQLDTPELGMELWRSDGSITGTRAVKNINENGDAPLRPFRGFGPSMLFWGTNAAGNPTAHRLVSSDGSDAGTFIYEDLQYIPGGANTAVDGQLFFGALDLSGRLQLLGFDGRAIRSRTQVLDNTGVLPGILTEIFNLRGRLVLATSVYSASGQPLPDVALWQYDLESQSLSKLAELGVAPRADAVMWADKLYFTGLEGGSAGIWSSDGTVAGTTRIVDLPPIRDPQGALFNPLGALRVLPAAGRLLFQRIALDGIGSQLWSSDGTAAGTTALNETYFGTGPAPLSAFEVLGAGERALVAVNSATGFTDLWVSDGTTAGTQRVAGLDASSIFEGLIPLRDTILFRSRSNNAGQEPHAINVGAQSTELSPDCNSQGRRPRLHATDPWLGEALRLDGLGDPGSQAYICFDLPRARALNPTELCGLVLVSPVIASPIPLTAEGAFGLEAQVPADPSLRGQSFVVQAVLLGAGLQVSNGLLLHMETRPTAE